MQYINAIYIAYLLMCGFTYVNALASQQVQLLSGSGLCRAAEADFCLGDASTEGRNSLGLQ